MADKKKDKKPEPKKGAKGKKPSRKGKGKGLGRGARVFLTLIGLAVVVMGAYVGIDLLGKQLRAAKTMEVAVDLEVGGNGTEPGRFNEPWGLCMDRDGNLVVADFGNHRLQVFDAQGSVVRVIGERGDKEGQFEQPTIAWADPDGNLFVADTFNYRVQKLDSKGKFLGQWKRSFFGPRGIVGDGKGRVYITDTGNHKIQVFDPEGRFLKEFGRGPGSKEDEFHEPQGSATDPEGNLYVCDTENRRIKKYNAKGELQYTFKVPGWKGKCCESAYAVWGQGSLFVTHASDAAVLRINPDNGKVLAIYKRPGGFQNACGITMDAQGRLWVSLKSAHKVVRFMPPPIASRK